ncbi:hypothetical protein T265_09270 [Opisthorchis viverrini]|uniref:Uncharacterized protein n=1 Tax=Opisthorchis viverrini TaxID=6198 RepID=A0A075A5L4_OPIVI|nr:hypothetical protein T265_09270 [Opisthorchis viverrini]KER22679.1 hypothetical protein T265_09270 [Opisthorchis viverrini]
MCDFFSKLDSAKVYPHILFAEVRHRCTSWLQNQTWSHQRFFHRVDHYTLDCKICVQGICIGFSWQREKSLSDERGPIVWNAIEQLQSPSTVASSSITQVSQLTGIARASVHHIMRRHLGGVKSKNRRGVCTSDA